MSPKQSEQSFFGCNEIVIKIPRDCTFLVPTALIRSKYSIFQRFSFFSVNIQKKTAIDCSAICALIKLFIYTHVRQFDKLCVKQNKTKSVCQLSNRPWTGIFWFSFVWKSQFLHFNRFGKILRANHMNSMYL